ncbi:MAG: RdgB/HAM1 family non-canonical purine NTP pyrophosphatase [Candidatus Thorarchaeota archaeon]
MPQTPLLFVTGNKNKFSEAKYILERADIKIEQYPYRPAEIQSKSLSEIARHSCEQVLREVNRPLFVEDAGMFIHHFNGFPGPYSSYVLHTLRNNGILKLMEGIKDRTAIFRSVIAYGVPGKETQLFEGETYGVITRKIRGTEWGFDPIFAPEEGDGSTYSEMPDEIKNRVSHRAKSLAKFTTWLLQYSEYGT